MSDKNFYREEDLPENERCGGSVVLTELPIVIRLPETTVEVEIKAKIYYDGELKTAIKKLNMKEVRDGFIDADENYFDPDAKFVLTEKGKALADILESEGM